VERGTPRNKLAVRVIHNGTQLDALVLSPRTAELHALMPYKAPPDMSRYVLSPMPACWSRWRCNPARRCRPVNAWP
jgi:propionyl-CoA carboxylase alpha chain